VWAVLCDGWGYAGWVVGAARIRAVQGPWPHPGALLHHTVGVWPSDLDDETEVLVADPPRRLVLQARGRPAGEARVDIRLVALADGGCEVSISEDVTDGPTRWLPGPARRVLIDVRNVETLRRLTGLAEAL
jgi:hypothetical protein